MLDFNIYRIMAFGIWYLLLFSLSIFLFSAFTKPHPNKILILVVGGVISFGIVFLLNVFVPLSISLLSATFTGVYGEFAYLYPIGIGVLGVVFTSNIFYCWGRNQPALLIQ
jgi:hypothetical protein